MHVLVYANKMFLEPKRREAEAEVRIVHVLVYANKMFLERKRMT